MKTKLTPPPPARRGFSMISIKASFIVLVVAVLTCHVNAAIYESNMGWTDEGPIALSPVSGSGPIVNVTFASSEGFSTYSHYTAIGYHHGGSNPIVTMTFSSDVTSIELSMSDLDVTIEDLDTMSPVPSGTTGDFYLYGSTVRSRVDGGVGSVLYDAIPSGGVLQFRFDYQLSNLGISSIAFEAVPEPATIDILGLGTLILRKRKA